LFEPGKEYKIYEIKNNGFYHNTPDFTDLVTSDGWLSAHHEL
jgi:hypothetical protein